MARRQVGQLYRTSKHWFVRHYLDGKRVSHELCEIDPDKYSITKRGKRGKPSAALAILRDAHMLKVNTRTVTSGDAAITVFWEKEYLPWIERNKRPATVNGYQKIWTKHLAPAFKGKKLKDWKSEHATKLLDDLILTTKLNPTSVLHVKSLASGIFSIAKTKGLIDANPWLGVTPLETNRRKKGVTRACEAKQCHEILAKLGDDAQSKLIFALAAFEGCRPGEIAAMRWSRIVDDELQIRESVWRGKLNELKTQTSRRDVPIVPQVRELLEAWRPQCRVTDGDWMFPNSQDRPLDMDRHCALVMKDALGEFTLYSGRRGCASILASSGAKPILIAAILGQNDPVTTLKHYIITSKADIKAAMRMMGTSLQSALVADSGASKG